MATSVLLSTARQELAKRASEFVQGTATSGSTTTVIDTNNLQYADEYWDEQYVLMTSGTNNGLLRRVQSYTKASSQATLYSALTASVMSGDTYELYRRFSPSDHKTALNAAINKSWPAFYQDRSTAVLSATADTLQYGFPTGPDIGDKGLIAIEQQVWTLASQSTFPYETLSPGSDYEVRTNYVEGTPNITPSAPTANSPSGGGNLNYSAGTIYYWAVSYVLPTGETIVGPTASDLGYSVTVRSESLTLPLGPAGTSARKLYRSVGGGTASLLFYVATINDNTTTAYTDSLGDAYLGAAPPDARPGGRVRTLQLKFNPANGRLIRFVFGAPIPQVSNSSDAIHMGDPELEWLYAQAKAELWRIEANRSEAVARKDAMAMLAESQREADGLKKDLGYAWPPKPIRRTRFYVSGA